MTENSMGRNSTTFPSGTQQSKNGLTAQHNSLQVFRQKEEQRTDKNRPGDICITSPWQDSVAFHATVPHNPLVGGGTPNILKMGQQQGEERYLAFWNIITARCPRWTLKGGKPESFYLKNGTNQRKILTYTWGNWMLPNLVWERQDRFLPRRENLGWNFRSSISLTLLIIPALPPLSHPCLCSVTSASYICIA